MRIHQLKIDFCVTEQVNRFVYVYLLEAGSLYLIDSGVFGSEKQIIDSIHAIGRDASELKGIFLTHAHPDHIGSAAWFQEHTGCSVYASEGERRWIEDIDLQFQERPIPNFYRLAGKSARVDCVVKAGDEIALDDGTVMGVLRTAGHSCDGVSYLVDGNLFIGDAVLVKGDIPIFIDEREIRKTLDVLKAQTGVHTFYPAWDQTCSAEMMRMKLDEAEELIRQLKRAVLALDDGGSLNGLINPVCDMMGMPMLKANPLFGRTVACLRQEMEK